jgi:meso-butanediol dehydrogenase/(S,S)-butanediol dehydrogenase/diacetyl reductase
MTTSPVAFITGAASGIGRAVAIELGRTHGVIGVDRSKEGLQETRAMIQETGGCCEVYTTDVTDFASIQRAVHDGEASVGLITAVAACAGIDVRGTAADTTFDDWHRSLSVNLTGVFATAKATLASLRSSQGSFTAIASDAGTNGSQGYAPYIAAKHGVVGLIRSMAMDFGPDGVRSNVICPGFVETPMAMRLFAESSPAEVDFYRKTVPLGRFAQPVEVARSVRHFVESSYANGTVFALDGGSTAGYFMPAELL